MKIEVEGLTALQTALRDLGDPRSVRVALRAGLRRAGQPMLEAIRARVPIDKGDLKRSIKMAAARGEKLDSPEFGVLIGIDANEQPATIVPRKERAGTYRDPGVSGTGPIAEFGRPGQPATPMFRPGFDQEAEATIRRFGEVAGSEIERAAARLAKKRGRA